MAVVLLASASANCDSLHFDWSETAPYTHALAEDGVEPLSLRSGCAVRQPCLFADDVALGNAMLAATGSIFPTFQNRLSSNDPSIDDVLRHASIVYDRHSEMYIHGIGLYKGPEAIGEYRVVPQALLNFSTLRTDSTLALPARSHVLSAFTQREEWFHLGGSRDVEWSIDYEYYPCSVMRRAERLAFPQTSADAFIDSAATDVSATVRRMCEVIVTHCTAEAGTLQFNTSNECEAYMTSLPMVDPACSDAYGPSSAMGASLMCKYLHHFMIPLAPELHCWHSGPALGPDAKGKVKCAPTDCAPAEAEAAAPPPPPSCTAEEAEEIATGTVYALTHCLPALVTGDCVSSNCTQALNTYLGRFMANGAWCACRAAGAPAAPSQLLELLQLDASAFLLTCGAAGIHFPLPSCLGPVMSRSPAALCPHPSQYVGSSGHCHTFEWEALVPGYLLEWAAGRQRRGRVTTSSRVATAECFVFSSLLTLHRNLADPSLVPLEAAGLLGGGASLPRSGADMPPLVVHPGSSAVIHQAHGAVLAALLAPQLRAPDSQDFWFCDRGGFDALRAPETISVLHDSGSVSHLAARRFYALVLPGLGSDGRMQPSQSVLALSSFEDDAQLVREALLAGSARALLGLADGEGPVGFDGEVGRMLAVAPSWFASEDWHRSRGYVLATGYLARRRKLVRSLREIITEARMAAHINASGLDTSLEHGYEATADMLVAIPSALAHSLQRLAWFVRRAPCERLPQWEASPERFVIEWVRLHTPVWGFRSAPAGEPLPDHLDLYDIAAANRDPAVFSEPDTFDPSRDLSKVLSWNMLEGDVKLGANATTGARACPARRFSVRFAVANAPHLFADAAAAQCSGAQVVHSGVEWRVETEAVPELNQTLRVFKAGSNRSRRLFVMLHGFATLPQQFAPLVSALRDRAWTWSLDSAYWAVAHPGWSSSGEAADGSCKVSAMAEAIAALVRAVRLRDGLRHIYVVGHDFGALVGWRVAQLLTRDELAGLVSFESHPELLSRVLRLVPARELPFYPLLSPITGEAYMAADGFSPLQAPLRNETWFEEWRWEMLDGWAAAGMASLSCFHRHNFAVDGATGRASLVEASTLDAIDTDVPVLMLHAGKATSPAWRLYLASVAELSYSLQARQIVMLRRVPNATHFGVLHGEHAAKAAAELTRFVWTAETIHLSILGATPALFNALLPDAEGTPGLLSYAVLYAIWVAVLCLISGLVLELQIGPMLLSLQSRAALWKFAQIFMVAFVFAAFAAETFLGIPLMILGVFKFGFPEVVLQYFHAASPDETPLKRAERGLHFFAILIHHFGGLLVYGAALAHLIVPLQTIPLIPLGAQHLASVLKHAIFPDAVAFVVYTLVTLGLEVWFQLEAYVALSAMPPLAQARL